MRISNYPTDTLDGTELILATNQDTTTQKYKTVNFTIDTLKTYIHTDVNDGIDKIIFEGDTKNDFETTLNASDPTADRAISLPNQSGTIPVLAVGVSGNTAITATPDEINYLDITTLGTVEASKVATADANGDVLFPDDQNLKIGTGSDLKIYHSSSNNHSYIHEAGSGTLIIRGTDVHINNAADTKNMITAVDGGAVTLFCDHVNRLATTTVGVTITGALTVTTNIDVDGTANLDDVDIDGNVQLDGTLTVGVDDTGHDVKFFGATASRYLLWDESDDALEFTDNTKLKIGTGGDFEIYHDAGTDTLFKNVKENGVTVFQVNDGGTNRSAIQAGGAGGYVKLYGNGVKRLETTTNGVTIGWPLQLDDTLTVGVDDTGYDVKLFGATAGKYLLWDASEDQLIISGDVGTRIINGGDNTNPSIYWGTDTNTGIYHDSDNAIKTTINGTKRVEVGAGYLQVYGNVIATEKVKAETFFQGTSEDLADGAAASLTKTLSYFTTSGAETATLAAGTEGQIKMFSFVTSDGGDMVITVTNAGWKASGTGTITFNTLGEGCTLMYANSKWCIISNHDCVFA